MVAIEQEQAAAIATCAHLDAIGHSGPRLLVHSDLGVVEWADYIKVCERLAAYLNIELVTVRRAAGDMMDRWEARWASSVRRYANLETVTLVLPWSTPALRFCTSELKTQVIGSELRRRFKGLPFINVTGIRREESKARSLASIASPATSGASWSWRPIVDWTVQEVFAFIASRGIDLHEGYTAYGMSRISCRFCIMSSLPDLLAAATDPAAQAIYCRMVSLEIASTFGFQGSRWLGDIASHLLSSRQRIDLAGAKLRAAERVAAEREIAPGMRYVKGWPTRMLTDDEAAILAVARRRVSELIGFSANHLDVASIHARYAELIAERDTR